METFKYVPRQCRKHKVTSEVNGQQVEKDVEPTFTGHLVLKQIDLLERLGRLSAIEHLKNEGKNLLFIHELIKGTKEFWHEVQLERIAGGKKYASIDDLLKDQKCDTLIIEVSQMFMDGFDDDGLGN
jgi:hypothetical protein